MASRRYERSCVKLPVNLIGVSSSGKFEERARVLDLSKGGLRIQTIRALEPGQVLEVFLRGVHEPYARCRVVWARAQGEAIPGEAGLEIQGIPTVRAHDRGRDFLAELREAYHPPSSLT